MKAAISRKTLAEFIMEFWLLTMKGVKLMKER